MIIEILIFLITFVVGYFIYLHKLAKDYFKKGDVKFVPCWPVFGNAYKSTVMKNHLIDDIDAVYRAFPDERCVYLNITYNP